MRSDQLSFGTAPFRSANARFSVLSADHAVKRPRRARIIYTLHDVELFASGAICWPRRETVDSVDWADDLLATTRLPAVSSHAFNAKPIDQQIVVGALMLEVQVTILTRFLPFSGWDARCTQKTMSGVDFNSRVFVFLCFRVA